MIVGIDDTDSTKGMCTTYLAAKICHKLGVTDLPRLVRLNPNIPYKTRGNGAVAFKSYNKRTEEVTLSLLKKYAMMGDKRTNPGVAVLDSDEVPKPLADFYLEAVSRHVSVEEAEEVARKANVRLFKFKNGRGIIGALAAIGFHGEKTYELIAYRKEKNWGTQRLIDGKSIEAMDSMLYPRVFDNLSQDRKRALITPRGKDPILCGIRGIGKDDVLSAWEMVTPLEPVELVQVFETNQATDAHLRKKSVSQVKPYDCVIVSGTIASKPRKEAGGHVFFRLCDDTGTIDCAAYKKSKTFQDTVLRLDVGDEVIVCGGIGKYPHTINLEKIEVTEVAQKWSSKPPTCCGKNMTSAGKGKGYKCKKCAKKTSQKEVKYEKISRKIIPGIYDVPAGSRRHLSKPVYLHQTKSK